MTVAVVSSVYGSYDVPQPVPEQQALAAEWVLVTDNPSIDAPGWKVIVEPRPHLHPRMAAKVAKCFPFQYTNAETTVWKDGSCRFITPTALEDIVRASRGQAMAQVVHPWRDCIYAEAEESALLAKYQGQSVLEQVAHYRSRGYPKHGGLFATGLIVRNRTGGAERSLYEFGHRWLTEQTRWTYQDQLSQMPVLQGMRIEKNPLEVFPLAYPLHGSGVFEWGHHKDGT